MRINNNSLIEALQNPILLFDGAMGTMIQAHELSEKGYRIGRSANRQKELRGN